MNKYNVLVKIIDKIRVNAESNLDLYLPENGKVDIEGARSRALIHFFIKSYFGILDFKQRENLVTEGANDGGIDAYYINNEEKLVYLIQAKFRNSARGYVKTDIDNKDLWRMDLERVTTGEKKSFDGHQYNKKILEFQKKLRNLKNPSEYKFVVVLVANLTELQKKYILTTHFPKEWDIKVFNYYKVYDELLFPYIRDDFFNENKLSFNILLSSADKKPINYEVKTEYGVCTIFMIFIPTEEIAKALTRYKNSILKYNPRTYLGMNAKGVNKKIEDSILKKDTNDFVLLNNGITMLSTESLYTENTGKKRTGEITIKDPQIINGGQTSFTLSHIYKRFLKKEFAKNPFKDKEVLLKVIVQNDTEKYNNITGPVSLATNNQSSISKGDLLSNHDSQAALQKYIFEEFDLYYERKKGEFLNSLNNLYIKKEDVINRNEFIKMAYASGFPEKIKNPKNLSEDFLFSDEIFKILTTKSNYSKYVLSYLVYREVQLLKKQARKPVNGWFVGKCGFGLRYGDIAVTMIATYTLIGTSWKKNELKEVVEATLDKWKKFEEKAFLKKENLIYFDTKTKEFNPIGYYKSDNLITDLVEHFT